MALDLYLKNKEESKYIKPVLIDDYKSRISKLDKKLYYNTNIVYNCLYLLGYCYKSTSFKTINLGFETAKKVLEYVKLQLSK